MNLRLVIHLIFVVLALVSTSGCMFTGDITQTQFAPGKFSMGDVNSGAQKGSTTDNYTVFTSVGESVVLRGQTSRKYEVNLHFSDPLQD